jgi:hypothetical protein
MPVPGRALRACSAVGLRESGGAPGVDQGLRTTSKTASLPVGARRRCQGSFDTRMEAAAEGEQIEAAE